MIAHIGLWLGFGQKMHAKSVVLCKIWPKTHWAEKQFVENHEAKKFVSLKFHAPLLIKNKYDHLVASASINLLGKIKIYQCIFTPLSTAPNQSLSSRNWAPQAEGL